MNNEHPDTAAGEGLFGNYVQSIRALQWVLASATVPVALIVLLTQMLGD